MAKETGPSGDAATPMVAMFASMARPMLASHPLPCFLEA
jgi:hypothetical protein